MEIELLADAIEDFEYWKKSGNKIIQKKIHKLLTDITEHPFEGTGKPEQLKYNLAGKWSRRINQEHRIIYKVESDTIYIYSLKGHY